MGYVKKYSIQQWYKNFTVYITYPLIRWKYFYFITFNYSKLEIKLNTHISQVINFPKEYLMLQGYLSFFDFVMYYLIITQMLTFGFFFDKNDNQTLLSPKPDVQSPDRY